jgi:hypothetical protein
MPGQIVMTRPPLTAPPITIITLPWPWSVPWLPVLANVTAELRTRHNGDAVHAAGGVHVAWNAASEFASVVMFVAIPPFSGP